MKIIIIEDEQLTAKDLARTLLAVAPEAEIMAILPSVEEAVAYFTEKGQTADLIFSDIQLGDGLSFEIFAQIQNQTPVVFCTAFNQYALEAFQTVGIDYLLKPFSKATVAKALEKYQLLKGQKMNAQPDFGNILALLKGQIPTKLPSIIMQQADKIIPLDTAQVALFFIEDDYVFAYTFEKKKILLSHKLDGLEKILSPTFFRANRQFLVNRKAVKDAAHYFNRKVVLNLTIPFQEQIIVGKLKVTAFVEWLANH